MTADDQQDSANDALANATSIPVVTGQSFTERQLLDGLIVHSANDFADSLARYDAGSVSAFVAKMNATAAVLGMTQTHYTDPSGIDSGRREHCVGPASFGRPGHGPARIRNGGRAAGGDLRRSGHTGQLPSGGRNRRSGGK